MFRLNAVLSSECDSRLNESLRAFPVDASAPAPLALTAFPSSRIIGRSIFSCPSALTELCRKHIDFHPHFGRCPTLEMIV